MLNPVAAVLPFGRETVEFASPRPGNGSGLEWTNEAPVIEEEPEIVRLFAAHYRSLLRLRHLSPLQREHLTRLLDLCEAQLPECHDDPPRAPGQTSAGRRAALHQELECLSAIRLYAAGAQRALANGRPGAAAEALAKIIAQVERTQALLTASRRLTEPTPCTAKPRP